MAESTIVGSSTDQASKIREAEPAGVKKKAKKKFIPPIIRKKPKPEDNIMKDFYDSDDMPESEKTPKQKKGDDQSSFRHLSTLKNPGDRQTLQVTMNVNSVLGFPRDSVVGRSVEIQHTDNATPLKPNSLSKDSTTRDVKSPEWPAFTPYNNLDSIDSLHQQVWPHEDNNTSIQDQSQQASNQFISTNQPKRQDFISKNFSRNQPLGQAKSLPQTYIPVYRSPAGSIEHIDLQSVPRNVFITSNPKYRLVKYLQNIVNKNKIYHKDF